MKYHKDTIDKVVNTLADGQGRVIACKTANINYQTFLNWLNDETKIEFLEAVKKAEEVGNDRLKDLAKRAIIANFTKSWQSAAWWLERNHPKEFSIKQNVNLSNEDGSLKVLELKVSSRELEERINKANGV